MPLPVEAIQVDGGSEFKAEFEQACQANEQLLVLVELVTPRSIDPRTVPSISAITTGPTASSPDKPRPVTTKRAPPRPADGTVGISAVVATQAAAAKQAITDLGNMALSSAGNAPPFGPGGSIAIADPDAKGWAKHLSSKG
jgi:hypothetical protein